MAHRYDCYVLDLDGTLYRGNEPVPNAVASVAGLRARGARLAFLTNNSSQTRPAVAAKLRALGFEASDDEVFTSGMAAGGYCHAHDLKTAFVVGEPGLVETLDAAGIAVTDAPNPDAVVVGICKSFDYTLLTDAMQRIRAGSRFIATNADATYPLEGGRLIPGAGAIVGAVRIAAGVVPVVVGKPEPQLIEMAMDAMHASPDRTLVVGDRMETDIEAGRRAGCDTHLVLTGVTPCAPEGQRWSDDLSGLL